MYDYQIIPRWSVTSPVSSPNCKQADLKTAFPLSPNLDQANNLPHLKVPIR